MWSGFQWPEPRIPVEPAMWAQPDLRPRERLEEEKWAGGAFLPVTNRCHWRLLSAAGMNAKPVERCQGPL